MAFGWKLGLFSSSKLASASHGTQDEEDFLAPARVLLAVVALVTVYVDPAYHGVSPAAPAGVLILYLFHSLLVLKSRLYRREWIQASRLGLHVVDLLCAVCVPLFIGAQRPYLYYAFFVFVLLAAAYRWGLKETLLTAVVCITFLLIVAIMLAHGGWESFYRPPEKFDVSYFARRAGYLFVIAYIVGFVGEKQVEVRLADAAIARLIGIVHSQTRIREALGAALGAVMETFGANYAALVLKEEKTQRAFLWQAELRPGVPKGTICWEELENFQHRKYFFSLPGISCHAVNRPERTNEPFDVVALGDNGQRLRSRSYIFPEYFTDWHPFGSILVISFTAGQGKEWLGRLFVFDPRVTRDHEAELRLLRDLVREATPAAYTVYRLRRLRSRASEMERARIALELHDGVVQTLASIEMKVEALNRNRSNADRTLVDELNNIQRQLRLESFKLRDIIHQLRSFEQDSGMLERAAELVEEFRRETGIAAAVISESDKIELPPVLAHEVLRIVAEALTNVRKHSRAHKVFVHFASRNGQWNLLIEDDGEGFDFSGRLSHAELEATHRGPKVIRERVRSIGGELSVLSTPGRGARLEITFGEKPPHRFEHES